MKIGVQFRLSAVILAAVVFGLVGCSSPDGGGGGGGGGDKPAVIDIAVIKGVTAPVTGATPATTITPTAQYTGTVTWNENPSEFAASTHYTATITLTAKTGYTLKGVAANFFTVEGAALASNNTNSGVITAVFLQTGGTADNPTVIDIAAIQGVTVPATGGTPVTGIGENGQYSGTVTWSPTVTDTFAASIQYTATIRLTAKTGFTLQGVAANFFKVAGATTTNDADSGVITAVFPATVPIAITSVNISITAPVKGVEPVTTASGSDEVEHFTMDAVSWLPNNNPFLGNTIYTASVTLTANNGYTFADLSSTTINGQSAAVSNNTGSAVTLSYTFPATNEKTVTGIVIKTQPTKLTYTHGNTLDLTGLVVTLTHDDNTMEDIAAASFAAKNVTANPAHGNNVAYSTHNGQPVKITYGDKTCNTGNLTVNKATPTAADFNISGTGTFTYDGSTRAVTVTHKEGKSNGAITVKYNGITSVPSNAGTYTVTFDVAAAGDFNAASGLSAGTLTIEKATPTAADFTINGTGSIYYDGSSKTVTITPKTGKSDGTITVKYNGNTTAPSAAGEYTVTFDVAAGTNYNAASGFSAETLTIIIPTFTSIDELQAYLRGRPANTATTSYAVKLNVSDLGGRYDTGSLGYVLNANDTKYVSLDLSGNIFTSIGDSAFASCTSLTSITIPSSVTSIGGSAFYVCTSLTSVTIPDSVTSIGWYAFYDCTSLTSVTIGNSVTSIGNYAFYRCTSLTSITIPNSVTSIGGGAFIGCTSLTAINVDAGNSAYSSQDGVLYNKNKTTLSQYPRGKTETTFTIPNGVTSIRYDAFASCTSLTSITIPNSVTSIGNEAFYDCTSLTSVTFTAASKITSIEERTFRNCTNLTSITIPDSVTSIGNEAFYDCTSLTSVTIPNSVTSIGNFAFRGTSLTSVTIPNSVTSIGDYAFASCTSLTSVTIPNSVTSIGNYAFYNCTSLTSVTIPNSVTSIGNYAFYDCTSLTSVTIPNSVTSIEKYAFRGCSKLTSVRFERAGTSFYTTSDNYSFITQANSTSLRTAYNAGGIGTYTRPDTSSTTWTKQ